MQKAGELERGDAFVGTVGKQGHPLATAEFSKFAGILSAAL